MELLTNYICAHADYAHIILFCLLLLAGCNIPISEDLILLIGGVIASTCLPEHTLRMYLWIYAGCLISAWEAYCLGRFFGPKLYKFRLLSYILTPSRIDKLNLFYEKYGIFTFIVGRFCPGGVRNALFMTSGLGKMPFLTFLVRDTIACTVASLTLFWLGYEFGEHWKDIYKYVSTYEKIFGIAFVMAAMTGIIFLWYKTRNKMRSQDVDIA